MADGLGVELAAEVFQATIDLDGDHPLAGAEPACDADSGGEVGAGRGPREDALGASGLAGGLECLGFGNGHDFVVVGGVELGWAVADAAALDVMGPGGPPDSTADSAGSTTTRCSSGSAAASARLTPRKQPAVPT